MERETADIGQLVTVRLFPMSKLTELLKRAKTIRQTEGLAPLFRRVLLFVAKRFFKYESYYLYEYATENVQKLSEADYMPRIGDITLKVVSSNQEADKLETEGLEFRSQSINNREALDKGAVAFCIFVGQELANISWVAMTEEAKTSLAEPPYKVDFSKGEACTGGTWTHPKYRRMRLRFYAAFMKRKFMFEKGIPVQRFAMTKQNIAANVGAAKFNINIYAEARFLRVLWWKSWKEKPLPQPNGE